MHPVRVAGWCARVRRDGKAPSGQPAGRARDCFPPARRAAASVMAGEVMVGRGRRRAVKPGEMVDEAELVSVDERPAFVSRGGIKLANALAASGLDVAGRRALDVGASTGGFTDLLLQRGAHRGLRARCRPRPARRAPADRSPGAGLDGAHERPQPRARGAPAGGDRARPSAGPRHDRRLLHRAWTKVLGPVISCLGRPLRRAGPRQAPVRGRPRADREGRGGAGGRTTGARPSSTSGMAALSLGAAVRGYHSSGPAGPEGQPGDLHLAGRPGGRSWSRRSRGAAGDGAGGRAVREMTVFTHARPQDTGAALGLLVERAAAAGVTLRFDPEETRQAR